MRLVIATWNMSYWTKSSRHEEAWRIIDEVVCPDIALVQEAVVPSDRISAGHALWRAIGGRRRWGSGIVTKGLEVVEYPLETIYPGWVTTGRVKLTDGRVVTVISVHAQIERGYSITVLHRMFSDLTWLLEKDHGGSFVVLGGDFNAGTEFDERYNTGSIGSHKILFDRVRNFGLVDFVSKFHPEGVSTYRHRRAGRSWCIDHLFASDSVEDRVVSCEVVEDERIREVSDHNPIVLTLEV